jgi:hypothetical protein
VKPQRQHHVVNLTTFWGVVTSLLLVSMFGIDIHSGHGAGNGEVASKQKSNHCDTDSQGWKADAAGSHEDQTGKGGNETGTPSSGKGQQPEVGRNRGGDWADTSEKEKGG